MFIDFLYTIRHWRLVHLLGISTLRARYARSKFGQAWLSITTFVQILCTGLVWSLIWRMEIDEYLPYVGVGHIIYLFLAQTINESTGVFVADSRVYLNDKLPFMLSIGAHIYRNLLGLAHNLPTIILLVLWSTKAESNISFTYFFCILISFTFVVFSSYLLAALCTRFRDLVQLVALFFQLIFLVTPIMWKVSFLPEQYQHYVFINPFASMLDLLRNPLIGLNTNDFALISLSVWTSLVFVGALLVYSRLNRNIIYWV